MNIIKIKLTIHENCIRDITVKIKYFFECFYVAK